MDILNAFKAGIDDGFFEGIDACPEDWDEPSQSAYKQGYEHGVWLYGETNPSQGAHHDTQNQPTSPRVV